MNENERDHTVIPLCITEYSNLDKFDQAEAKAAGWPQELINDAVREVWRREVEMPNQPPDVGPAAF